MSAAVAQVVLVGPRAVGKTTLGRTLAGALSWPFADTDALLAAEVGEPAGAHLARVGEPAFRAVERRITLEALRRPDGFRVLALGGGGVLDPDVRAVLQEPERLVVFLRAPVEELVRRLRAGAAERPSLTGKGAVEEVAEVLAQRLPLYRQVADLELETDSANVDACSAQIAAKIRTGR